MLYQKLVVYMLLTCPDQSPSFLSLYPSTIRTIMTVSHSCWQKCPSRSVMLITNLLRKMISWTKTVTKDCALVCIYTQNTTTLSTHSTTHHTAQHTTLITHHTQQHTKHYTYNVHSAHIHTYVHCWTRPLSQFCMPTTSGKEIYSAQPKRLTYMRTYPITTHELATRHTAHAIAPSPQSLVYMHHLPQSLTSTLRRKMAATSMHQKYR